MANDLQELLGLIGGQSTPPAMGGPQPPVGMPYPLGAQGGNQNALSALAGIGLYQMMQEKRRMDKAKNSVGMQLDKPTQVSPFAPNMGQQDIQARAANMARQAPPGSMAPQMGGPPPGMPGMPPGMPPGGAPGGAPGAPNPLMQLMMARMQGGM